MPRNPSFPPALDDSFIHDQWEDDHEDREPRKTRYSIVMDMYHWCRPVFSDESFLRGPAGLMNHNAIGDKLREVGVTRESECVEDHESGGFYIYFSSKAKARGWIKRLNAWLAKQCEGKVDPADRLLGYPKLQYTLSDPNGDYVIIGRSDLCRIIEAAEKLDAEYDLDGTTFAGTLRALGIMIEDYREVHP